MADPTDAGEKSARDGEKVEAVERCDFCQLPISTDAHTAEFNGDTYQFCTDACREAMVESDRVFTEYRGHRFLHTGVSVLDAQLPQGLLRNSFILLSGSTGTRDDALHAEIVWRSLQRGEPAIYVTFHEPPTSVVENFLTLGWNVLPYLESGLFHILDCFTYRLGDRERLMTTMNDWNRHVNGIADNETTAVHDPSEVSQVITKLDACLEEKEMVDRGIVLIDSLTEFGTLLGPVQAYDLVKDVRAEICKGQFVPVFAGATVRSDPDEFPHDLEYLVDGIVDMRLNPEIVENTLIKQIRIRKMSGVLAIPEWTAYEFTSGRGLVMFDPVAEIEKARSERQDEEPDAGTGPEPDTPEDTSVEESGG
ncbi:MAG: RAD55 family ATPase [Halobacteriales archaeon]|nr:RAD55 family ATPase [Halobacteriales archaeon]